MDIGSLEVKSALFTDLERAAVSIHAVDASGTIVWANQTELDLLGYKSEEYIGKNIEDFHADKELCKKLLSLIKSGETVCNFECRLLCSNGSTKIVLISSSAILHNGEFFCTHCFTVDITAQRLQENNYRRLTQAMPAAIYTCDKEGNINYFNDLAVGLWGYRPEMGNSSQKFCACYKVWTLDGMFLPPEETPMAVAVKEGKVFRNVESVVERPDGTRFYAVVNIEPLTNQDGEITGAINVFQDITNIKETELRLKASECRNRQLVKKLPVAVYTCDPTGIITSYNEAAAQLWGREPEIGSDMWCGSWKIFQPDGSDLPLADCPMAVAIKTGKPVRGVEIMVQRPDGSLLNVLPFPSPILDEEGNVREVVNTLIDVTTLKMSEKLAERNIELAHQKEFLETILNTTEDLICAYDHEGRFLAMNRKCSEITGVNPDDAYLKSFEEVYPDLIGSAPHQNLNRALQGETLLNITYKARNGTSYYTNSYIPLKEKEEILGAVVIAHDNTDILSFTEKLADKNRELEQRNQELASFNYIASHDLQEPLRKISTFSSCIIEAESGNLSPKSLNYFSRLQRSTAKMQNLISDLLLYSRVTSNHADFDLLELDNVLDEVLKDMSEEIRQHNAEIINTGLPGIRGIRFQLEQLFTNLLSNSLKFAQEGVRPKVVISSALVDKKDVPALADERYSTFCEISIRDNGIGFKPELSQKIFELFQRLHSSFEYQGTGVGLSICRKIAENHGGTIQADSEPGNGACFRIYLPAS